MKKYYQMKTIGILIFLILTLNSCKTKNTSYDELLALEKTHSFTNAELEKSIEQILKDSINYRNFKSPIILVIIKKNMPNYEVCISRTDYNAFKRNRPDDFNTLKGYLNYKEIPILLFGDIDKFFKRNNADFYNVLGNMPEYTLDNPPAIYEPRMMCSDFD